ncbi:hypothetical protein EVAR_102328_1 [Eumeta japonica]|uniref:Uncharacterized protein n=1 Tax=Eumeta variegata TaxID=151549 RepID=A0A4C1ZKS9_EUMVA|nr:hypothetical protein EVAR_102328_1 [Eumeta japonica]
MYTKKKFCDVVKRPQNVASSSSPARNASQFSLKIPIREQADLNAKGGAPEAAAPKRAICRRRRPPPSACVRVNTKSLS